MLVMNPQGSIRAGNFFEHLNNSWLQTVESVRLVLQDIFFPNLFNHSTVVSSDCKMFAVERNPVFWILYFIHRCSKRHVLLKFLYLGWEYQGYATQEDTANTIEHHLFSALVRCCLVESRQTSNYGRCGRTDKGVSSFSQVYYRTVVCASFLCLNVCMFVQHERWCRDSACQSVSLPSPQLLQQLCCLQPLYSYRHFVVLS